MDRDDPDFDQQDSGVPVTPPDRNPDPLGPQHSVPEGMDANEVGEASGPAGHVRDQRAGQLADDADEEPARSLEGGPAVPGRDSGLEESNPAQGA